jgi:hypothetical protein
MIRLATKTGDHVADVQAPHFDSNPDVLMWGSRLFAYRGAIAHGGDPATMEYREVSVFVVPIPLGEAAAQAAAAPAASAETSTADTHGFHKVTEPTPKTTAPAAAAPAAATHAASPSVSTKTRK